MFLGSRHKPVEYPFDLSGLCMDARLTNRVAEEVGLTPEQRTFVWLANTSSLILAVAGTTPGNRERTGSLILAVAGTSPEKSK